MPPRLTYINTRSPAANKSEYHVNNTQKNPKQNKRFPKRCSRRYCARVYQPLLTRTTPNVVNMRYLRETHLRGLRLTWKWGTAVWRDTHEIPSLSRPMTAARHYTVTLLGTKSHISTS
ncbi:uncharacterized protein YALI1_A00014g [Yarrowia lipolytica]|uniref:Uncharacterized protein n=1 Tax=Yarrowia lipolytica TaxID=4952 RepID=A0A1D8N374_YARLL|nr:hypothetical protein YALI1_A00014g [Yarrowia lipolytica]